MTREEAISRLKEGEPFSEIYDPVWDIALNMAIKALEQEPCEDCISRQVAIDAINSHFGFSIEEEYGSAVQEVINGLPSAENNEGWIPVSERLPKAYQKILVTCEEFHWANEPTTYCVKSITFGGVVDFVAWQPLPEPYKTESEEK